LSKNGLGMILGKVVGEVWGTKKVPNLEGLKLLEVESLDAAFLPTGSVVVAADQLGAGIGEYVIVAVSSRSRDIVMGPEAPVKAVVLAIVDGAEAEGRTLMIEGRSGVGRGVE